MIVNNWYVFLDFQNWRDCSSEQDHPSPPVLKIKTLLFSSNYQNNFI